MYLVDIFFRVFFFNIILCDEVLIIDKEVEEIYMVEFLLFCKVSLDNICKESLWDSMM